MSAADLEPLQYEPLRSAFAMTLDELAVLADLFEVPFLQDLLDGPDARPAAERAAAHDASLRSLVARQALMIDTDPVDPSFELVEPYASLLSGVLAPDVMIRIQRITREDVDVRVISLRDGVAITQVPLMSGVHRLVVTPAGDVVTDVGEWLGIEDLPMAESDPLAAELGAMEDAENLIDVGDFDRAREALGDGAEALFDLLYARRTLCRVLVLVPEESGRIEGEEATWMDCGDLGLWNVDDDLDRLPEAVDPEDTSWRTAAVTIAPAPAAEIRDLLRRWLPASKPSAEPELH